VEKKKMRKRKVEREKRKKSRNETPKEDLAGIATWAYMEAYNWGITKERDREI